MVVEMAFFPPVGDGCGPAHFLSHQRKVRDSGLARGECCGKRSAMKTFSLLSAATALILCACDRHEWEGEDGVKKLYEHHDGDHGGDHKDEHGKADEQKKKESVH